MSLETYIRAAPKAELHVHLEGSIRPETLLALARRNGVELPCKDAAGMREWFTYSDFKHFIEVYVAITRCLKTAEDYETITYEFGAEMARQNIRYAEVTFSPSTHRMLGVPFEVYFAGLSAGRERARRDFNVEINWVFDLVRKQNNRSEDCDYTLAVALEARREGVVALGLGGPEVGNPPEDYIRWFEKAREAGLRLTPHAGETVGPPSVWGALGALGAERIGHGVRAIEDPKLVDYLAEHGIPLEICPTSNLRLGVFPSMKEHPLRRLHDAGVIVTVNSDDPPLFNTTLNDEWAAAAQNFGFEVDQIDEILLNGVRRNFLPAERRAEMEREFVGELDRLKRIHLP